MRPRSLITGIVLLIHLFGAFSACKKSPEGGRAGSLDSESFKPEVPSNFPAFVDNQDNHLTEEGIELGRMLFYDKRLSGNNMISCENCHRQEFAFTDALAISDRGVSGKPLTRHAPALFNLVWADKGIFWDGDSKDLESQAINPITNPDEMNQDMVELEKELKLVPDYVKRFDKVFNDEIRSSLIVKALGQFERILISANSRYDKFKRKESGSSLTDLELQGLALIEQKCKTCHSTELFTDHSFHNNGIDAAFSTANDGIFLGRSRVTNNPADMGKFKTPSLRNIAFTAPFMHDGRFKTLQEVLDHYSSGVKSSATLDNALNQNNGKPGIPLTASDKIAIIAFLGALTDDTLLYGIKISNPHL